MMYFFNKFRYMKTMEMHSKEKLLILDYYKYNI